MLSSTALHQAADPLKRMNDAQEHTSTRSMSNADAAIRAHVDLTEQAKKENLLRFASYKEIPKLVHLKTFEPLCGRNLRKRSFGAQQPSSSCASLKGFWDLINGRDK